MTRGRAGSQGPEPLALPREVVLASAGSGKTYRLSIRFIALLDRGIPPEVIWASTFTRKAAGEILQRVLLLLARGALDPEAAAELARNASLEGGGGGTGDALDPARCGRLLTRLVRSLHRINVGTLDSFFVRIATAFSQELGLGPGWRLVDEHEGDLIRGEALEAVLAREDPPGVAGLVRTINRGEVRRGVHEALLDQVSELLELDRDVLQGVRDPWTPALEGIEGREGPGEGEVRKRRDALAGALADAQVPVTGAGRPDARWSGELQRLAGALRDGDWNAFFEKGLGKKLVEAGEVARGPSVAFYKQSPDPDLARALDACVALARVELGRDIIRQGRALGRLARDYRRAFEELQAVRGRFRFGDITHLLREARVMGRSDDLYFRLDARIRHLLLDEFQDTSLPQWEVLEPVVEEILAGGEVERATVLVADPKQSIYGWRGARPELVDRVRDRFGLADEKLTRSWRSGPVILEAVRRVFDGLEGNPVLAAVEGGPEVARGWMKDFYELEASDPEKPGFAQLVAAPPAEAHGAVRPAVLDFSAELVGSLHSRERGASIGVLVRTNRVVRYLIAALKRWDVAVSGEGGTPLTDTAPVNAVLALLRMADHPGDRLSRYHVAKTPVGELVGYTNPDAGAEARRLARGIRDRLMREGYGLTLDAWARALAPACDGLQWARLLQLVELGFRWDPGRTLRTGDFVRFVEAQRVDDPSGAGVRVMTVHQSKGLEFDVVVLPHLYDSLGGRGDRRAAVPVRDRESGRVLRIYPATGQSARALFPELRRAHEENRAMGLRDELSALYVAMTRARYALHMVVPGDGERGQGAAKSPARILRAALASGVPADRPGRVLWCHGDEAWHHRVAPEDLEGRTSGDEGGAAAGAGGIQAVSLRSVTGARTRNLPRLSPSAMEGGDRVDLATLLRMDLAGVARLRGTIVHAWCEEIAWLDDGPPDPDLLLGVARERAPGLETSEIRRWLADFAVWLSAPEIAAALRRSAYPPGARVEREVPFLHRVQDGVLHGLIDRLVVWEVEGRVAGAQVLDFKTDLLDGSDPDAVAARVEFYRPQIEAYRRAVAGRYGLESSSVSGKLLLLRPGLVREV